MVGIKSCGDGLVKIFSVCLEVFHTKIFGGGDKAGFCIRRGEIPEAD